MVHFRLHEHLMVDENVILTEQSHLCSIVFEQPIELLPIKIEFMSTTLLHYVTLNINTK